MHCRIAALLYQDYIANSHNASNYKTAPMLPMTFGSTSNGLTLSRNLSAYLGLRSSHQALEPIALALSPSANCSGSEGQTKICSTVRPLLSCDTHTIGHTMVTRHVTRCHKIQKDHAQRMQKHQHVTCWFVSCQILMSLTQSTRLLV